MTFQLPTVETCIPWTYRRVIGVSVRTPQFHLCQPVLGVINEDCIQAECLYSSQTKCFSRDTQQLNCKGTGANQLPT